MAMTRRTAPKKATVVEAPEPIEIAEAPATVPENTVWQPTLGMCVSCSFFAAHSEADHLCYGCHKDAAGFVFNAEKNRYVKGKS